MALRRAERGAFEVRHLEGIGEMARAPAGSKSLAADTSGGIAESK